MAETMMGSVCEEDFRGDRVTIWPDMIQSLCDIKDDVEFAAIHRRFYQWFLCGEEVVDERSVVKLGVGQLISGQLRVIKHVKEVSEKRKDAAKKRWGKTGRVVQDAKACNQHQNQNPTHTQNPTYNPTQNLTQRHDSAESRESDTKHGWFVSKSNSKCDEVCVDGRKIPYAEFMKCHFFPYVAPFFGVTDVEHELAARTIDELVHIAEYIVTPKNDIRDWKKYTSKAIKKAHEDGQFAQGDNPSVYYY